MKKFLIILFLIFGLCVFFANSKSNSKTKLQFLSWGSESEVKIINSLICEYEKKNPQIDVEFIHAPSNYFQKLHLLVASNLVPDVVFVNNINSLLYFENGVFEDLNPYINNDDKFKKENYFKKSIKAFEKEDKLYAIPRDVSNLVIYYNKDLFDKYNVAYPVQNWSFDDFLNTSKKLTKDTNNDGKTDVFGFGFEEKPLFWLPFLWSEGGGILNKNGDLVIDSKESKEALGFYADLRNKYRVSPSRSEIASLTTAQMFMQGKVAMHISGRWNVPRYRKDIKFDWDIISFPNGKNGSVVDCDSSGWAISSKSKNKKQAWDFIKFLSSKKNIEKFSQTGLIIPARVDVANSKLFLEGKPKSSYIYIKALKTAVVTPVNSSYNELLDKINIQLEYLWTGKKSVNQAIDKLTP